MARLCLSLLGLFQASLDDRPVSGFETVKTRALLAYLADEPGRAHSRSTLAGLLFPERAETAALNNLRHVLANLRHAIHDPEASLPFLLIDRETIALDSHSDCLVDTLDFRRLVDSASGRRQEAPSQLDCLEQAVCLYRGDFLESFLLEGSPDFEEWILIRREMYRSQFLDALYELAEASLSQGEYNQVKTYAHRQISIEPWREEAHRQLIQALALGGRRCEALVQYAVCCSVLKKELGVEPSQETVQLFECIRDGRLVHEIPVHPPSSG
jgi:DNA-binding SARP family transcriptional activator